MYLDFSDPLDIGRDCTGNNNHAINQGVEYKSDAVRTHTAYFDAKTTVLANETGTNMSVLSLTDKIDIYKPSAYSFSFKFKLNTVVTASDTKVIVGYGLNTGDFTTEDKLLMYVIGAGVILAQENGSFHVLGVHVGRSDETVSPPRIEKFKSCAACAASVSSNSTVTSSNIHGYSSCCLIYVAVLTDGLIAVI
jgi:hypothetical protein